MVWQVDTPHTSYIMRANHKRRAQFRKAWLAECVEEPGVIIAAGEEFGAMVRLLTRPRAEWQTLEREKGIDLLDHPLTVGGYGSQRGG